MATVRIEGLKEVIGKIDSLRKLKAVKDGLKAAGLHIKGKIAKYPRRKTVTIAQAGGWASDRQRRGFFAKLRSGEIEVPYRRGQSPGSQDLGQRWTIAERDGGLTVIVGNNTDYGPFVQDKNRQTRMMKMKGWKTIQDVAEDETKEVVDLLQEQLVRMLGE